MPSSKGGTSDALEESEISEPRSQGSELADSAEDAIEEISEAVEGVESSDPGAQGSEDADVVADAIEEISEAVEGAESSGSGVQVSESADSMEEAIEGIAEAVADLDAADLVGTAAEEISEAVEGAESSDFGVQASEDADAADAVEGIAEEVAEAEPEEAAEPGETTEAEPEATAKEAPEAESDVKEGAAAEDAGEAAAVAKVRPTSPFELPGSWFVIHSYSGYENKVKANLGTRIKSMHMEESIFDIVIPLEDVVEIKGGRKVTVQKKQFPGYLLVRMYLDDDSWSTVRNTPGVTGFVGSGNKPTALSRREVERILGVRKDEEEKKAPRFKPEWEVGETVRVVEGPFADFNGVIEDINIDQSKVRVLVDIFGRETPVELNFEQIQKF